MVAETGHLALVAALHPLLFVTVGHGRGVAQGDEAHLLAIALAHQAVDQAHEGLEALGAGQVAR